jgi:phosphate transport system protein
MEIIRMGSMCEECIDTAIKGFLSGNNDYLERTSILEQDINQQERIVESLCMKILLKQHPVARDLRHISAALKMISDMERIGDQSFEIAELAKIIKNSDLIEKVHIREMADSAIGMVSNSIEAFVKSDREIAEHVISDDDIVDEGFNRVKRKIIKIFSDCVPTIAEESENAEYAVDLLMIAKYLERIGDHAVNIAEWVIYALTGIHAKKPAEEV